MRSNAIKVHAYGLAQRHKEHKESAPDVQSVLTPDEFTASEKHPLCAFVPLCEAKSIPDYNAHGFHFRFHSAGTFAVSSHCRAMRLRSSPPEREISAMM